MLSIEDNKLLTEVGPGTPMGDLLRRYWQPVCALDEISEPLPHEGADDHGRGPGRVLRPRWPPRPRRAQLRPPRASLAYGIVEEDGLRCVYHGWKFNQDGECVDQPFEDTTHPEDNYAAKCSIPAYPVQELAGLVWAYMGPAPAPILPRWGPACFR